jgi:hypothetical protein
MLANYHSNGVTRRSFAPMSPAERAAFSKRAHYLARAHDILVERDIDPVKNWDLAELLGNYMQEIKDDLIASEGMAV